MINIEKLKQKHDELWGVIYKNNLFDSYSKYEKTMKKIKQYESYGAIMLIGLLFISVLIGFFVTNVIHGIGIIFILAFFIILVLAPNISQNSLDLEKYREELIPQLLESMDFIKKANKKDGGISCKEYKTIGFIDRDFNEFCSDYNLVTTKGIQEIEISNIKITYNVEDYSSEHNRSVIFEAYRFEGFVALAKFDKNILDGYIHIFTDKNRDNIGINKDDKILMDSSLFESKFDVYSNDKIKAFMLLTPDIMEKILEKTEKYKVKMEIVISNNIIAIRIFDNQIRFTGVRGNNENKLLRDNVIDDIKYIYDLYEFMGKIIDEVNNNFL